MSIDKSVGLTVIRWSDGDMWISTMNGGVSFEIGGAGRIGNHHDRKAVERANALTRRALDDTVAAGPSADIAKVGDVVRSVMGGTSGTVKSVSDWGVHADGFDTKHGWYEVVTRAELAPAAAGDRVRVLVDSPNSSEWKRDDEFVVSVKGRDSAFIKETRECMIHDGSGPDGLGYGRRIWDRSAYEIIAPAAPGRPVLRDGDAVTLEVLGNGALGYIIHKT